MARPMIVIALACILARSIGHAQESDTLLDDPRVLREGNETSKMLFQLPQQERHETMTRFISANGLPCAAVTRTMYQGSAPDGVDFWSIDCGNASYMALFSPTTKTSSWIASFWRRLFLARSAGLSSRNRAGGGSAARGCLGPISSSAI
jgi:hypothetical protein